MTTLLSGVLGLFFSFVLTVQNTFQFVIIHAYNQHAVYIPILVCLKGVLRKLEEHVSEQLSWDTGSSAGCLSSCSPEPRVLQGDLGPHRGLHKHQPAQPQCQLRHQPPAAPPLQSGWKAGGLHPAAIFSEDTEKPKEDGTVACSLARCLRRWVTSDSLPARDRAGLLSTRLADAHLLCVQLKHPLAQRCEQDLHTSASQTADCIVSVFAPSPNNSKE